MYYATTHTHQSHSDNLWTNAVSILQLYVVSIEHLSTYKFVNLFIYSTYLYSNGIKNKSCSFRFSGGVSILACVRSCIRKLLSSICAKSSQLSWSSSQLSWSSSQLLWQKRSYRPPGGRGYGGPGGPGGGPGGPGGGPGGPGGGPG